MEHGSSWKVRDRVTGDSMSASSVLNECRSTDAAAWLHLESRYPNSERTVRVLGDHLGRLPKLQRIDAGTVVFFGGSVIPGPAEQPHIVNNAEPSLEVERIVLNVPIHGQRFYSDDGHDSLQIGRGAGMYLREVVYVFQPVDEEGNLLEARSEFASKDKSKRGEIPDFSDDGDWIPICDNLTDLLDHGYAPQRITFVGLPPRFYLGEELVDPAACLRTHIEDLAHEHALWDYVENHVRFVSLPEYLKGPNAKLETSMPGWPKRLPRAIKDASRIVRNPIFGDSEQLYYR
ncbi:hypothetical protein A1Q1_00022 [Trichosporon asahii var. asahii CBS 2479]|uniref:Uncharacterized protein n=1 Tax=Trichosporon asahii var. asahii (strain ATCC 90039 / CBS 2479 / JCM 2466 / KCTC 7840 / NBRC 103889/ NCYC 2677 / UAMH 7654) TaxID=1186058 RepID=J8TYY8_TRIAS|nr:hypothetical protein A1Q1_00022 [Trichosporon asahii var. asahii CBS 2479]EJT53015.1 hypothetical protein A1Q1_00022 [Trichosporon asahii var. asahii CBS 2479]